MSTVSNASSLRLLFLIMSIFLHPIHSRLNSQFLTTTAFVPQPKNLMLTTYQSNNSCLTSPFQIQSHQEPETIQTFQNDYELKKRNPYDVHVYYHIPHQQDQAMEFRLKLQTKFPWMNFYTPKNRPIGPHPIPMWEADFGQYENYKWLQDVCDFITEEHGDLSILIHPHSMDGDYMDHTKNAIWFGDKLKLRIDGWQK